MLCGNQHTMLKNLRWAHGVLRHEYPKRYLNRQPLPLRNYDLTQADPVRALTALNKSPCAFWPTSTRSHTHFVPLNWPLCAWTSLNQSPRAFPPRSTTPKLRPHPTQPVPTHADLPVRIWTQSNTHSHAHLPVGILAPVNHSPCAS